MLSDRNYMSSGGRGKRNGQEISGRQMVYFLIGINVVLFLLSSGSPHMTSMLSLSCQGLQSGKVFQLITAMFMHGSFSHLLFNMYGLYLFGTLLDPLMDGKRILLLYLVCGFIGNILFLICNWGQPYLLLGASGSLFGIMMAVAMLRPNIQFMMLLPPIPVKARTLVVVYALIEIFIMMSNPHSPVAHLAHLGGLLAGYAMIKIFYRPQIVWDIFPRRTKGPRLWRDSSRQARYDLDYLLDKISVQGINSLTPEELEALRQAREKMRGKH